MTSIDTSVLLRATNTACPEHPRARAFLELAVRNPRNWTISDQVLFEYYRLVRSPGLFEKPLSAEEAACHVRYFREEVGWRHCAYDRDCWNEVAAALADPGFDARRVSNLLLAVTLRRNGVEALCTHNPAAFRSFGWLRVVDPLA